MDFPRLSGAEGVLSLLQVVAAVDGVVNVKEQERIDSIKEDLAELAPDILIAPAVVLSLVFDVAVADGCLHEAEESFLSELAAASDWAGTTLDSLRSAWDAKSMHREKVKKFGLLSLGSGNLKYTVGHAIVDICSAIRRRGGKEIRVRISKTYQSIAIIASQKEGVEMIAPLEILGFCESANRQGILTRSTAALELHIAAAGSLVARSTTVLSLHDREVAIATSFGRDSLTQTASLKGLEWARSVLLGDGGHVCVLLEDLEEPKTGEWRREVFDEIVRIVDKRLHRWGADDCPGGRTELWIDNFRASHGAKDPFRRDALPRRVLGRFVEPRPGLMLEIRVHPLVPLELSLARRVSMDQDMVSCVGLVDGLLRGLPAPGIFLYDDMGRCILSEYFPHSVPGVARENEGSMMQGLEGHRVRIDVLERPDTMQSIDCLNFASVWKAILQCTTG